MDKEKIEQAVRLFLEGIGENPEREGLKDTPHRISVMCDQLFGGYSQEATEPLSRTFHAETGDIVLEKPLAESFDFAHYCAIHRFLFEDLYEWAGKPRTVDIAKKGTQFCLAAQIESTSSAIFSRLEKQCFLVGLDKAHFISAIVDLYERTNELHPFREGNGRTQRVFLSQLARHAGYVIDFARVDPDDLMIATIQAAGGVDDFLKVLFDEMVV